MHSNILIMNKIGLVSWRTGSLTWTRRRRAVVCSRVGRGGVTSHQSRFPSCHHLPTSLITTNAIAIYNLTLGTTSAPQVTITASCGLINLRWENWGFIVGHGNHPMAMGSVLHVCDVLQSVLCSCKYTTSVSIWNMFMYKSFLLSCFQERGKSYIGEFDEGDRDVRGGKWIWQKGLDEKVRSLAVRHEKVWKSVAGENGQTERSAISWHSFSNSRDT